MRTLFLDIASHDGLIACVSDTEVLTYKEVHQRIGDHELMPIIEKCVDDMSSLTHLACVIGPGGFTSLRVAVSLMNTMSWALNIPSCGIHLSDLYAERVRMCDPSFLWLHSTKKSELFIRGFGDFAEKWPEPILVTLHEATHNIPKSTLWCGELILEHQEILSHLCPLSHLESTVVVLPHFLSIQTYNEQILKPWYGRGW